MNPLPVIPPRRLAVVCALLATSSFMVLRPAYRKPSLALARLIFRDARPAPGDALRQVYRAAVLARDFHPLAGPALQSVSYFASGFRFALNRGPKLIQRKGIAIGLDLLPFSVAELQ